MKLITWNCQGAFRKKADYLLSRKPDLLVIQECEHPDKLKFSPNTPVPTDALWFGDNQHKGLGIFSYGPFRFKLLKQHNPAFKIIVPISVKGGAIDFTLLAIWANNPDDPEGRYVEQTWKAIHHYNRLLQKGPIILTGDFNSNTIWDREHRVGSHSALVEKLALKNIHSLYHLHHHQEQGKEMHPTFFLHRNKEKPYHLDYCFTSRDLYDLLKNLQVGKFEDWIEHSDHLPLEMEFDF